MISNTEVQTLIEELREMANAEFQFGSTRNWRTLIGAYEALSALSSLAETETEWGVKHSQGTNWCRSERDAREQVASFVARDSRSHFQARGIVRLVKREQGPVIEVENPYETVTK